MNLKSKSKMFKALVEKMDIALSSGTSFNEVAGNLKKTHLKVKDDYVKPIHTDLCTILAIDELESR